VLEQLQNAALYRLGGVEPLLLYIQMMIVRVTHLRVAEVGWEILTLVVGSATVVLAFFVVAELQGRKVGLLAGLLLAVNPLSIMQSRSLAAPWAYEEFFQVLIIYYILCLPYAPKPAARIGFHLAIATYLWAGNQMLGIFPVLAFGVVAMTRERPAGAQSARFLWRSYGGWSVVLPVVSLFLLLYSTFILRKGHLAHALFDKEHELGFYLDHWIDDMSSDIGPAVTWIGLASVLLSLFYERHVFAKGRILVLLFICYAAPFWFLVPPHSTLTRGYITYGLAAMLLVLAATPFISEAGRPWLRFILPSFVILGLLITAGHSAYGLYDSSLLSARAFQGSYRADSGIKAAAWWIRSQPNEGGRIFSDAWGGGGLEPPLMDIYFKRPYFAIYDAPAAQSAYERFKSHAQQIDYLLIRPEDRGLARRYFGNTFHEAARITGAEGGELLVIYTRGEANQAVTTIDAREGGKAFDARYSLLCTE
jgi:hypothetical protein